MDTAAYLTSQGWRGDGHALHHSGRGITKPLAVSQKRNVLGIGQKKHDAHADQWWARAFDATLKGINSSKDANTGETEGISLGAGAQALRMVGKGGAKWVGQRGLYSNFVKGEGLNGTLTPKKERTRNGDERSKALGTDGDDRSERTTNSRKRPHKEGAALSSRVIENDAVAQDRNEPSLGRLQYKADDRESKEKQRERRKERQARRALKDGSLTHSLPFQAKAKLDDGRKAAIPRPSKRNSVNPTAKIESAVPGNSRSKSTKKKRQKLAKVRSG